MCGIAVVLCGVRIELSDLPFLSASPSFFVERLQFSAEDIRAVLGRRGPDSLGEKKIYLQPNVATSAETREETRELVNTQYNGEIHFIGSTLQLRGTTPISQPLVDSSGNILVYNGEVFEGITINSCDNDTEVLLESLGKAGISVPDVLSKIKGPWAITYWQESLRTLWFGRDAFGRRSLLVHWPTVEDSRFLLSSVSPSSSVRDSSGLDAVNGNNNHRFWEELPCGIYSITMKAEASDVSLLGEVTKHEWRSNMLKELIEWERNFVVPRPEDLSSALTTSSGLVQTVLAALKKSVMRRTSMYRIFQGDKEIAPVAVLFSGGLDSMILAALLDQCLDPKYEIDLLNVSFDGPYAPDRVSAKAGVIELENIAPMRRWKLVEIDADLSKLTHETKHVMSLINPADTYMDLNIGTALWLAARGDGWIYKGGRDQTLEDNQRVKYKSEARVLLIGAGADEQCAGYGRHRTKFRNGSWVSLHKEMKLDMQRIWKRNLGRDDRCIADIGKEARFPFLDEDVIKTLLDLPLWEITNLEQPSGTGDKKILREVARSVGLHEVAGMPKRAIQFGSRIARESNRKNFGSNRAANQASAGSVRFIAPSE
ncbi:PREDICTED: asparagine synthetase domain-containing protein 1 [Tarenaya hassleriana]|uniref:asparagine synthetase domain-containing protein 1 n=1 Tax=Tarenaya hassleriana TaxID=28532 RepID=UPI00053C5FA6|nr:PREDICTED: asparagine synthetase domain-containing protein 1 [Tarenaya hassleriana]